MTDAMIVVGHVLMGSLFVIAGVRHAFMFSMVAKRIAARVPAAGVVLALGSVFEVVAGAALAAQAFMPWSALGLIVFTAAATLMALDFWNMPQGPEREGVMNAALANLAIIGGLLIDAAHVSA